MFPRSATLAIIATGMLGMFACIQPSLAGSGRHAAFAIDANTGAVLSNEDGDAPRHPASLTKMMTLYMTFEAIEGGSLSMRDRLAISEAAASVPPSKLGLEPGEDLSVGEAVRALITKSANDVAVALAERLGGSHGAFVAKMNARARDLGMNATIFKNASGLPDPAQITTARDMTTLALALQDHYPQYYELFATRAFTFRGKSYRNHNTMLNSFNGIDGIKTGYTRASGFNLVSSVRRGGRHVVAAVFGGASAATRNGEMRVVLSRALIKASTDRTRKGSPLLIAKLKSAPKIAERKKPKALQQVADATPAAQAPKPFAPAKKKKPEPESSLKMPAEFPRYIANAAAEQEAIPEPVETATPVEVFKVKRVAIAQRAPEPPVSPDQTTDMPDSIALALLADAKDTEASVDAAAAATEAALHETNVPKTAVAAVRPPSPLDTHIAMLGAADVAPAEQPTAAPAIEPAARPSTLQAQAQALKPAKQTVATAATSGVPRGFAIQIGAYVSIDEAARSLASIKSRSGALLASYSTATSPVAKDGRQLYRARFTGFDANAAASTCNELRRQSVDCFVLASQ